MNESPRLKGAAKSNGLRDVGSFVQFLPISLPLVYQKKQLEKKVS